MTSLWNFTLSQPFLQRVRIAGNIAVFVQFVPLIVYVHFFVDGALIT